MILATITLIALLPLVLYIYYKQKHSYWAKKNVPSFPPSIPFGNFSDFVLRKKSLIGLLRDIYIKSKQNGYKYTGIYMYFRKGLFVSDPALIKRMLTTDFQYFHDRDMYFDEVNDPLTANVLTLNGPEWKNLRAKLTPTFTSGKLKMMFKTVLNCSDELINILERSIDSSVEIKGLLSRFTTDVIGCCAFGIDCNSLKNPDTKFGKYSQKAMSPGWIDILKLAIFRNFPQFAKFIKLKIINTDVSDFFLNVVRETIDLREQNNIVRNDFMQLLIQLKNSGKLDDDNQTTKSSNFNLTFNEIAAQSFIFFLAGYDTSATASSFALFELSKNELIQEKLRREIFEAMKRHGGTLTYEAVMEMEYMEKVVMESLRKYPAISVILRKCTRDYHIPDSKIVIEKETPVFVSIWGLHSDPEYFPNPDHFDPDRFDKENVKNRPDYSFIPFGDGPRICLGLRFAMMQVKIVLAILLSNFKYTLNSKTNDPLIFDKTRYFILSAVGGIWLNVLKLNKEEYCY